MTTLWIVTAVLYAFMFRDIARELRGLW